MYGFSEIVRFQNSTLMSSFEAPIILVLLRIGCWSRDATSEDTLSFGGSYS